MTSSNKHVNAGKRNEIAFATKSKLDFCWARRITKIDNRIKATTTRRIIGAKEGPFLNKVFSIIVIIKKSI